MLDLLSNALLQALTFGIAAVGVTIAFRVIRYPDLTADGSFMLGSAVFAYVAKFDGYGPTAIILSMFAGAAAGVVTSFLNTWLGVSRLLSGILTTMIAYSIAFRFLSGRSNIGLDLDVFRLLPSFGIDSLVTHDMHALLASALFAAVVASAMRQLLRSELGLLLRSTGSNSGLIVDLGRSPAVYQAVGLGVANALIGLSAALVSIQQGFVDINLGVGVVITLVAALVLGEELFIRLRGGRRLGLVTRVIGPFAGALVYFVLYLLILKASIQGWIPMLVQPTDLKLLAAALVILVVALRRKNSVREDILPL